MTISQILQSETIKLKDKNIKNPHLQAELLLSAIIIKPREWILSHPEHKLTSLQITNYKLQISRLLGGTPLPYLIGYREFYGRKFIVNKKVLIPRPETELMIDEVVNRKSEIGDRKTIIIDVGTGSGCIIITLYKELQKGSGFGYPEPDPAMEFYATDVSKPALAVARQNAKLYKIQNIKFICGNLLKPVIPKIKKLDIINYNLVILANLPYLTPAQYQNSPTIQQEPKSSLVSGDDGFKYYQELFKQLKSAVCCLPSAVLYIEIDPAQKNKIKNLVKTILPDSTIKIKKDLKGHSRLAIISIKA
jgi:release factor glutamine methyltransferase